MARRSGLGRGLGALLPPEATGDASTALRELPLSAISPNPHQPRAVFDEEALSSLTASIREVGVLQPVLVRPADEGAFELIAGERRWRAARRAGLQTIPALVRPIDEAASLEQALVENLHREDLNGLEEAAAYQQLIEDFHLTHEAVAARVGKSRAAVSNALRLFQLPAVVQRMVAEGALSAGHARALLGSPDRAFQEALAARTAAEHLSVRAVEEAIRRHAAPDEPPAPPPVPGRRPSRDRPAALLELEERLAEHLSTTVRVDMGARRGRVVIDFATMDDLERLYRAMTQPEEA